MIKLKCINFFLLFVLVISIAEAQQEDCAITLKNAQKTYDDGAVEKVVDILQICLESGFTKEQKIQAYRLLVLTYLYENNRTEANKNMVKLLKLEPEYQANVAVDPPEFIKLYESYRTLPLYSIGVIGGGNFSFINVTQSYSLDNSSSVKHNYTPQLNFQGGINLNRYLFGKCYLSLDIMYALNKFGYGKNGEVILDNTTITYTENQTWIRVPLTFTYDFDYGKWKPYARLGFGAGYLLSDKVTLTRGFSNPAETVKIVKAAESGSDIDMLKNDQRNVLNYWLIAGAGLKYKIKKGYFSVDIRYNLGLMNSVNAANRYSNSDEIYKYYYIDSDFKLSDFTFSLGYTYLMYKPQKKKLKTD